MAAGTIVLSIMSTSLLRAGS